LTSLRQGSAVDLRARSDPTIATDRGDITRIAPDKMVSRNDAKWSADASIAFISDRSGA
jgi:hypothetical protein